MRLGVLKDVWPLGAILGHLGHLTSDSSSSRFVAPLHDIDYGALLAHWRPCHLKRLIVSRMSRHGGVQHIKAHIYKRVCMLSVILYTTF